MHKQLIVFNSKLRYVNVYIHENRPYFNLLLLPNSSSASDGNKICPPHQDNWFLNHEGIGEITDLDFSDQVSNTTKQLFDKITDTHTSLQEAISIINDDFIFSWNSLSLDEKKLLLFSPGWSTVIFMKTGDNLIKKTIETLLDAHTIRQPKYKPCSLTQFPKLILENYAIYFGRIHHVNCAVFKDKLTDCECF